jgi:ribosomal protein S18 acetylase RimI-like enzyme
MARLPHRSRTTPDESGRIRQAGPGDAPALVALEAESFREDRLQPRQWRYLLRRPSAEVWIEERIGTPGRGCEDPAPALRAAMVLLFRRGTKVGRIYSLATARAWRGRGLAGRLLAVSEQRCRLRDCDRLSLEVREDNQAAIGLYERSGFRVLRRLRAYYADGGDGLRLEKPIGAPAGATR